MGWGSIADKLNRTIGGYRSEEQEAKKLEEKAKPVTEAATKEQPKPPVAQPREEKAKPAENPAHWSPPVATSIYDAPAITRESVPAVDAPAKPSKTRRARKPKQEAAPKEEVAAVAT